MSSLSTHVLDTSRGAPAAGVGVTLAAFDAAPELPVRTFTTDASGRVGALLTGATAGRYRLCYDLGAYPGAQENPGLYPLIELEVMLDPGRHHHIVLTLSPYGYFVACVQS